MPVLPGVNIAPALEVPTVPDQPAVPPAVQDVALVLLQDMVFDCPRVMVAGTTVRLAMLAAGGGDTAVTTTVELALPPLPVQVSV